MFSKYLWMPSFYGCEFWELSDEISNLKLLRYLDLSQIRIKRMPDSICMLYNLQTLILQYCKLTKLRHLNLEGTDIKMMSKQIGRLSHLQTLTYFVVEEQSGSDIRELAKLNHLQGTLEISGLENVIDPADAVAANLKDKKHLEELSISYDDWREIDDSIIETHVSILEALQPCSNLNRLAIEGYRGSSFPNWLRDVHLPNLVSLKLHGFELCSRLPPLGQFPSLKKLSIFGCDGIEIIGPEFYGDSSSNVPFRSLEILEFNSMFYWKEWLCLGGFPLLKEISVRDCLRLKKALPQHLPCLQKLVISFCDDLEASIPKGDNISQLELRGCENILIKELPLSLRSYVMHKCPKLIASRKEWGLFKLNSLETFIVSDDFENVESFPEENLLPLTIKSLWLENCSKLRIINYKGFLHLKSLKSLHIEGCPCLERLPEEGLPNSMSTLRIIGCPLLKQRYQKEGGDLWHKISHIPSVRIDNAWQK